MMHEKQLGKILVQSRHSLFPANIIIPSIPLAKVIFENSPEHSYMISLKNELHRIHWNLK